MTVIAWANERSAAMTMWDVGILKVTAMLFGMILGALAASFVVENLWLFAILTLALGARSGYRWFTASAHPS